MANSVKVTKKDRFSQLLAIEEVKTNADLVAFINHEVELLNKKNSSDRKPSKAQVANDGVKAEILACMEVGKKYTITDMLKEFDCVADFSNQKLSALVRQLKESGAIVRTEDKRKAYFSLAEEVEIEVDLED